MTLLAVEQAPTSLMVDTMKPFKAVIAVRLQRLMMVVIRLVMRLFQNTVKHF